MKKVLLSGIIFISILLLISCSNQEQDNDQPFNAMESSIFRIAEVKTVRTLEKLEVKSGASEMYKTIAVLEKGNIVPVLGKIDNWYVIRLENYQIGCIESTKTEAIVADNHITNNHTSDLTPPEGPDGNAQKPDNENADSKQENQLFNLINQERNKNSLPHLKIDGNLTRTARIKAQDMIDNNYFSHYSPTYGSPFDMMKEFNINYQYAGENIAQNTDVNKAHTALMNSSGHRKNILNPNFTHIGIGIKKTEKGYIYVEMFTGIPQ